jgi:predicted ATPase
MALCKEQGFALYLAWLTVLRGWTVATQGQREAGMIQICQGLGAWRATGAELSSPYFLAVLAEAYAHIGQLQEGLACLKQAFTVATATEEHLYQAELYRLQGEVLRMGSGDQLAEAEASFQQALAIARHQHAKSWELRTATSLARLWQSQGKRQEAYDLLAPVYGWFTEGFDTADGQDAKTLLDELSEAPS